MHCKIQDSDDRDFKMKHEAALRNIGQLKNQIDALKAELRDKKLEINDLEGDSNTLKQQLDEKNIEFENYRNDYKGCIGNNLIKQLIMKNLELKERAYQTLLLN